MLIKLLKEESAVTELSTSKYEGRCPTLRKLQNPQRAFRKASKKKISVVSTTNNNIHA